MLDFPPGTVDIQLILCQDVELIGAVVDARKGVKIFLYLGVPTLAAVGNMSYFDCPGVGRYHPFGKGLLWSDGTVSDNEEDEGGGFLFGLDKSSVFKLPISFLANGTNDTGVPMCLSQPNKASDKLGVFYDLVNRVAGQLIRMDYGLALAGLASAPPQGDDASEGGNDSVILDKEVAVTFTANESSGGGASLSTSSFDMTTLRLVLTILVGPLSCFYSWTEAAPNIGSG
eukprot:CAMPEP_0113600606 /NCGR_PEP_ID=MMETSP0015_2-20120614/42791_1 /TAXON_ID=2838 /ORGANISM="Odontella" /LENGTH=228 /DNA_ID=CAMNT_0000508863 /DNA_START=256 /DNA_END=939 /DNA_ORIENTATION=+ /assembly_acc=CAM_ASM_000160